MGIPLIYIQNADGIIVASCIGDSVGQLYAMLVTVFLFLGGNDKLVDLATFVFNQSWN